MPGFVEPGLQNLCWTPFEYRRGWELLFRTSIRKASPTDGAKLMRPELVNQVSKWIRTFAGIPA